MEVKLNIRTLENVGELTAERLVHITEIFEALVVSGGLTGVKGGSTVVHFDQDGEFMGVQLNYWPYRRRKQQQRG
jgi:hypothetical protein